MSCTDKNKFKTAEASSKAYLRTNNIIDKTLTILNVGLFRKKVTEWTKVAKERYGVDSGRLFLEEKQDTSKELKAVANKEAFSQIDKIKKLLKNRETIIKEKNSLKEIYNKEIQENREYFENDEPFTRVSVNKKPIQDTGIQGTLFQEPGRSLQNLSEKEIENLQSTVEYQILKEQEDEDLTIKGGQSYVFLNKKDAERFSFLLNKEGEFPKQFNVTIKVTRYIKDSKVKGKFNGFNEYKDYIYLKANNNKKSNLYDILDKEGVVIAENVRVLHVSKDVKKGISEKYGLEFTPTKVFSANRSIAFTLYRLKPSKNKYIAQAKKYIYDALKFLNPEETNLKINLEKIEEFLESFPEDMWDYINTTYSPENSTNINASISLQNKIKFELPKLGLLQELEKITGIKLQDVSFKNYDRTGGLKKVLRVEWGDIVVIDYQSMTKKQLKAAVSYYLKQKKYFKQTSEEENVKKYAEHRGIDYNELRELVFGNIEKALENIAYNETGNSDEMEVSKWRESIRNYDWQSVELFYKPYENFQNTAKERITKKFKDKTLSNGISHLDYFFSGNFNWLNINFNNISGQYFMSDMETEADTGFDVKMVGFANPFELKTYKKPKPGKNFLEEKEVFNRLAAILHEPFHALHALSYGTEEELQLRKAFDNLYNTDFGKEMMNQVFGSGYNQGQQISYDTLYKEFTAFATQLMLYPKEWITKTDLRSNDIYDFIQKIQTLQDKTYEEIIRTQKKIGTTEKTITEEEQIKLNFLEKLYNYLVSALNKIIPLSKKFFDVIADSKLVEKTVIEDVFGETEETVTKTLKLPENIKKAKEEFLSSMEDLKSAINTLMQIDSKLFSPDNINKFFNKDQFNQEPGKAEEPNIKPGVEELFESNPELANAVYEALGFKEKSLTNLEKVSNLIKQIQDFDYSYEGSGNDYLPNRFNKIARELENFINDNKSDTSLPKLTNEYFVLIEQLRNFKQEINFESKEYQQYKEYLDQNEFLDKLSPLYKKIANKEKEIQDKFRKELSKITPREFKGSNVFISFQQKQQAILLYSQYLNSLNKPNTNPILQGNQQEQVKKFAELQERLNNKEFLEGAKSAYESTPALQQLGTQKEYNDYIARVSLGILKNPSSGEYNYDSKVKDIVYNASNYNSQIPNNTIYKVGLFLSNQLKYVKNFAKQNNKKFVNALIINSKNVKYTDKESIQNIGRNKEISNILDFNDLQYIDYLIEEEGLTRDAAIKIVTKETFDTLQYTETEFGTKDKYGFIGNEYVVFEPEQIHVLGGKQDTKGFQEFVGKSTQTVESYRAQEQAELSQRIPNIENYKVDGKVVKSLITDENDLKIYNEIYDKYDALITPLLEASEETKEQPEDILKTYEEDLEQDIEDLEDTEDTSNINEDDDFLEQDFPVEEKENKPDVKYTFNEEFELLNRKLISLGLNTLSLEDYDNFTNIQKEIIKSCYGI